METFTVIFSTIGILSSGVGVIFLGLYIGSKLDEIERTDSKVWENYHRLETHSQDAISILNRIDRLETEQSKILKRHGEDMERVLTKINALEKRQRKLIDLDIWVDRLRERVTTLEKGS